jgi:ArsR family metal-binding transcriptional regulator
MAERVGTFPHQSEFAKAKAIADSLGLACQVVSPEPGFGRVGVPAMVLDDGPRGALMGHGGDAVVCSGWVDYRPASISVPARTPLEFADDIFGQAAIVVLADCIADTTKVRLIAHISGDLTAVFPYLNAEMQQASYNKDGPNLTFMDKYRMVSLYPSRIAIAKADEIVDAWRVLEMIRCRVNEVWSRRGRIEPSYERRAKPPALEIYYRLPKTNCRACGQKTCMAFALHLWSGNAVPSQCKPVFEGEAGHLKPALMEICVGLGISQDITV